MEVVYHLTFSRCPVKPSLFIAGRSTVVGRGVLGDDRLLVGIVARLEGALGNASDLNNLRCNALDPSRLKLLAQGLVLAVAFGDNG